MNVVCIGTRVQKKGHYSSAKKLGSAGFCNNSFEDTLSSKRPFRAAFLRKIRTMLEAKWAA
jgi:hypothetical protein